MNQTTASKEQPVYCAICNARRPGDRLQPSRFWIGAGHVPFQFIVHRGCDYLTRWRRLGLDPRRRPFR